MDEVARTTMPSVGFGDDIPAGTFHGSHLPSGHRSVVCVNANGGACSPNGDGASPGGAA